MFGWTTKPSHVLTSAKCVFFQLSGVPNARRVASHVHCPLASKQPQEVVDEDEVPVHLREKRVEVSSTVSQGALLESHLEVHDLVGDIGVVSDR